MLRPARHVRPYRAYSDLMPTANFHCFSGTGNTLHAVQLVGQASRLSCRGVTCV